jgi:hypothetical protein
MQMISKIIMDKKCLHLYLITFIGCIWLDYKPNEAFEGYNRVKTQLGKQFELSCCNFLNYKWT